MAKSYGVPLFFEGLAKKSLLLWDLGMDLLVPPLTYVVLASFLGACAAAAVAYVLGQPLVVVPWAACLAFLALYIVRGVILAGVGFRGFLDLLFAPVYMAWKVALALKGGKRKKDEWVRTAREGEKPSAEGVIK